MRPLLLSTTFLILLTLCLVFLWGSLSRRNSFALANGWDQLWCLLADRRLIAFLLLGASFNVSLRLVTGYINPRDYVQDAVAARQFLRHESLYPADMPAMGAAVVAAPMAGRQWLESNPILRPEFDMLAITAPANAHPPFLGLLSVPALAAFGLRGGFLATSIFSAVLLCLSLFLIVRELFPTPSNARFLAILGLTFGWHSVSSLLRSAQPAVLLLFLILISWLLLRRGRPWAAGIPIGIAACIQAFPALLLLYFALRYWRSLLSALATVAAISLSVWACTIPGTFLQWLATVDLISRDFIPSRLNLSLAGIFVGFARSLHLPVDAKLIGLLSLALVAAILAIWLKPWIRVQESIQRLDVEFALFTVAMLLASPLFWSRYLAILLLPLVILLRYRSSPSQPCTPFALLWVLLALSIPDLTLEALNSSLSTILGPPLAWLLSSLVTLAVLILSLWTARLPRNPQSTAKAGV